MSIWLRKAAAPLVAVIILSVPAVSSCVDRRETPPGGPANIILFIGDGMGIAHLTAARIACGKLHMERFEVAGLLTTWSSDELVTDSAASATAMATGVKTRNGSISVDPGGTPLRTVIELAEERGMRTGLVSLCSVTHATPAAFASHVADRDDNLEIARQMALGGVDVLIGGGLEYFLPATAGGSARTDTCDPMAALRERMAVVTSIDELRESGGKGPVAAFLAQNHPGPVGERDYTLAELTDIAVTALSSRGNGFFLMVEGSQIDWEAHDNNAGGVVLETVDFDRAVGAGLDFAEKNGRTLVIVAADHETGGFALLGGSLQRAEISSYDFSTEGHTASMVPLLAFGPNAEDFGGIHDNAWLGGKLISLIGFGK
ncbi:MAG: alkaline phosphatase [Candidatus Krumholzibacteria bacterium]|jgi:alkaline phosphatase|nr:alkaline phosphatase [Candidatus Krumholzibacteria bacterium]